MLCNNLTTTPSTTSPVFKYNHNEEKAKDKVKEKAKEKTKKEEERISSFSFNFSISFAFDNSCSSVPLNCCSLLHLPLYNRRHAPRDNASSSSESSIICIFGERRGDKAAVG